MIKQLIKSVLNPLGIDIVKYPPPSADRQFRDFILDYDINIILDVGACDGLFCQNLRRVVGYKGEIISFEPCSRAFNELRKAMNADKKWKGYQIGLSDSDTEAVINTYGDAIYFNSFLDLHQKDALAYEVDLTKKSTETIQLRKLDTIWNEVIREEDPRILLKTDTQGHDVSVIKGAKDHLSSIVGVQAELPALEIYEGMTSMPDILRSFSSMGFTPIGFYPVNKPAAYNGAVPEFDVFFKLCNLAEPQ